MIFNIENLEQELQEALKEFNIFTFSKDGVKVQTEMGKDYIAYDGTTVKITYSQKAGFIYSLFVFDTLRKTGDNACAFEKFSVMVDMSRNAVRTVETVKNYMRKLVLMGYTELQLYMEDVYEIPEEAYFGHKRGRYSQKELKEIVAYGKKIGIKCVPAIQTLAHLEGLTRWRRFAANVFDKDNILLVDEPQTYELIEKMFKSMRECFDCEEINIGMDEAHNLGLGKYLRLHGFTNKFELLTRHLSKVAEIAEKYNFKPMMWGDMFIRVANNGDYSVAFRGNRKCVFPENVMQYIPKNITLCAWAYYPFEKEFYEKFIGFHQAFERPVRFVSGAISWWGVTPMNKYSIKQNAVACKVCKKYNVKEYMLTIWGDDGAEASVYSTLPTLAYTAGIAYNEKGYKQLFERLTGIAFDKYLRIDLPNTIAEIAPWFEFAQPAKYMLYNDCLQGLYDSTVHIGDYKKFKNIALKLHKLTQNEEYGYIFKTLKTLCNLLYYKYELTIKTRTAYLNGDKATLQQIVDVDYKKILQYLEEYYENFYYQWHKESKPHGFEVMAYRLGGLKQRMKDGRRTIQEYLDGKTENILELEDPTLSVLCDESRDGKAVHASTFVEVVTANCFTPFLNFLM